jgi:hypothetical protein
MNAAESYHYLLMTLAPPHHTCMAAAPNPAAMPPTWGRELERLVDGLVNPSDAKRTATVQCVIETCVPRVIALVCDRLVVRFVGFPWECRGPARDSLQQFGSRSLPAVT